MLLEEHIPGNILDEGDIVGFRSALEAKTKCRQGAICYLNKYLGIKLLTNLHKSLQNLSRKRTLVFLGLP